MSGIYIHIPFCRQKCYYCDFYKTVNTSLTSRFISALRNEAKTRNNYLKNEQVKTIYFGGGTPSVLTPNELSEILAFLSDEFNIIDNAEITFEANPDDLTPDYLNAIFNLGINRLSIGIQSFDEDLLKSLNRRHNSKQAIEVVKNAAKTGFKNLSADLIYGLPGLTSKKWGDSLALIYELPVQHLSAYHLTYHEGTPFYTWLKKGTLKELNESESIKQFKKLIKSANENGFEQYEISNFAKEGLYSKHNSSYWKNIKYLGLGPSAHSYNGDSRRWNISHTEGYILAVESGKPFAEEEVLTMNDKFNEFILTGIRTKWGVSLDDMKENFGMQKVEYFLDQLQKFEKADLVQLENGIVTLTQQGIFVSDDIMSNLMYI
jgi:oxygen-independent coproporphyrinogen-3 oxidase